MKIRAASMTAAWLLCGVLLAVPAKSARADDDDDDALKAPAAAAVPPEQRRRRDRQNHGGRPDDIYPGGNDSSGALHESFVEGDAPLARDQRGAGTVVLSGQRTFSGGTTIDGGTLVLGNPAAGIDTQSVLGTGQITINNGARLRLGEPANAGAASYNLPNNIQINKGVLASVAGNPHFTGRVTVGPGGATLMTHAQGEDMFLDADLTGAGPLAIDNDSPGTGGTVRVTNDLSLMGTITLNGPSAGCSGGRISLEDPDALNEATLAVAAGMRGIDFAPKIKAFSLGGLTGEANIDFKGHILRVGVANTDLVYSGNFTDSVGGGGFIKSGAGTMTLTGTHDYHGSMSVHYGTLVIAGAVAGEIKVGDPQIPLTRAMLKGTGTVGNILLQTPGAWVQPGPDAGHTGILTARNFSMIPGSNLSIRLGGNGAAGTEPGGGAGSKGYDQIRASGQFSLYGNLEVSLIGGFQPKPGDVFYIMVTSGHAPALGRFANFVSNEFTGGGYRFRINYTAESAKGDAASVTGHDVALIALGEDRWGESGMR